MADDAARDWISAYGGAARTPHIDSLAKSGGGVLGVLFETVWAEPMCTPSRVQALTGQYPFRTGWLAHHDVPRWGGAGLELVEPPSAVAGHYVRDADAPWVDAQDGRHVAYEAVLLDDGALVWVVGRLVVRGHHDDITM